MGGRGGTTPLPCCPGTPNPSVLLGTGEERNSQQVTAPVRGRVTTQVSQPSSCTEAPIYLCPAGSQQLCLFPALAVSLSPRPACPCSSPQLHIWLTLPPCRLTDTSGWGTGGSHPGQSGSTALGGSHHVHGSPRMAKNTPSSSQPFPSARAGQGLWGNCCTCRGFSCWEVASHSVTGGCIS